jgi:hypothetical protein
MSFAHGGLHQLITGLVKVFGDGPHKIGSLRQRQFPVFMKSGPCLLQSFIYFSGAGILEFHRCCFYFHCNEDKLFLVRECNFTIFLQQPYLIGLAQKSLRPSKDQAGYKNTPEWVLARLDNAALFGAQYKTDSRPFCE